MNVSSKNPAQTKIVPNVESNVCVRTDRLASASSQQKPNQTSKQSVLEKLLSTATGEAFLKMPDLSEDKNVLVGCEFNVNCSRMEDKENEVASLAKNLTAKPRGRKVINNVICVRPSADESSVSSCTNDFI